MRRFQALAMVEWDDVKEAIYWLLITVGGMLPLWLLFIPLLAFSQPISIYDLGGNGEFALYSAAILSGAVYLLTKGTRPHIGLREGLNDGQKGVLRRVEVRLPGHRPLTILAGALIMVSAAVFMVTTTADLFADSRPGLTVNRAFLMGFTLIGFVVSTGLSFLIAAIANASMDQPELTELWAEQPRALGEQFDKLSQEVQNER